MTRRKRRDRDGGGGGQAQSHSTPRAGADIDGRTAGAGTGAARDHHHRHDHRHSSRRASPSSRILNGAMMARVAAATARHRSDDEDMGVGDERHTGAVAASASATTAAAAVRDDDDQSSSGSDFLSSQAEIREKRARREAQKAALASASAAASASESMHSAAAAAAAASSAAAAAAASPAPRARLNLPGYVFDERRNKYFKLLPSHVHAAAAGRDADDAQDSDDDSGGDGDGGGRGERRARQSHTSARFASLRVTGDPRLHAQSMHAHLSAAATSQQLSARIRAKKRPRSPAPALTEAARVDPALRALHVQAHSRNVLLNLHARQIGRPFPLAPALRLQSHLPALLRPLPLPLLRYASTPQSQPPLLLSGEHALSYEPHHRLLSVAGKRCWSGSSGGDGVVAQEAVSGSFYATFQLEPLVGPGAAPRSRCPPSQDEHAPAGVGAAPPFRLRQVALEQTDSPVTSMHRFAAWEMRFPPAESASAPSASASGTGTGSGSSSSTSRGRGSGARGGGFIHRSWGAHNAFTEERNLRAHAARFAHSFRHGGAENVWAAEEELDSALNAPISNLLALTKLGAREPGSFELHGSVADPDPEDSGEHARFHSQSRLYTFRVHDGSVWTSAFPRSMAQAASLPATAACRVALGCTKGGLVVDLVADRVVYSCHTNKSDILAQCWLERGAADDVLLLSGSRDGVVRMDDTRQPNRHSAAAAAAAAGLSLQLSSSVCFLQQLRSNENHLLAAAVDGQMCLYDLRRCSPTPTPMAATAASSSSARRGGSKPYAHSAAAAQPVRTLPLLCFSGHANSFTPIRPFVHESTTSSGEHWLFCGGEDGRARAWNLRESQPILDAEPLRTPPLQRRIAWKHAAYIDEFRTLLCASELGVAALTLGERT